jgi:hypothetical protein
MSFPSSPTNGQVAVVNGITYTYNSTKTAWTRSFTTANAVTLSNGAASTSTTTGTLQVQGGVGITGNVFAGGQVSGYHTGPIGANTANTGVFTSVTTTSAGQITGYHTGAIGANTANSGAFTTLTSGSATQRVNFNVSGNLIPVSGTHPAAGNIYGASTFICNTDNAYGLLMGSYGNGDSFLQAQRVDGTATTYNLQLNPAGGSVGIGTGSPGTKLDAYTSGTTSTILRTRNDTTTVYLDANNGYAYLNTFTNHPLLFGTNNTERMRIDSSGNVGIGTSSPGAKLDVNGNMQGGSLNVFGTGVPANGINNVTTNAVGFFTNSTNACASTPPAALVLVAPLAHGQAWYRLL